MDAPHPAFAPTAGTPVRAFVATAGGELAAGLAAMLVAVPSALAFGVAVYSTVDPSLAGAGAMAGVVGAAALGIVAPLVGRNAGFVTAPCAPAAAVLGGLAASFAVHGDIPPDRSLALIALTGLLSAALQVMFGALRVGRLIKYIPYQVVTGYLCGVAVIIATTQLPRLMGMPRGAAWHHSLFVPATWEWHAIAVGTVTIAAMVAARRYIARVPGPLVALAAGVAAYLALALFEPRLFATRDNALVVGPIGATGSLFDGAVSRFGALANTSVHDIMLVVASAATLAVLLSIDTLKTGVVLDAQLRRRHDSNRELLAQGTANFASFLLGGMPGAGTMGPSLVNVSSGARTWWAGLAAGGFALLVLLVLAGAMAWVPIAALAGILVVVAFRMFDFRIFRLALRRETRLDFAIIAAVIAVAQAWGLIQAALAGVALAVLLFIRDQTVSSVVLRKRDLVVARSSRRRSEAEMRILQEQGGHGLLIELKDNLFFGTTDQLLTDMDAELARRRFILLDLRRVASVDYTAAHLFDQVRHRLKDRDGALLLCGMPSSRASRQDIRRYIDEVGLTDGGGVEIFETRDSALESMEARILEAAGCVERDDAPALELAGFPQLQGVPAQALALLDGCVERRELTPGDVLFNLGDAGAELFFVRRGQIHIRLPLQGGKHHHLATFGRGELFGEMSFLDDMARSADAVATTQTSVFVLARDRFDALACEQPQLAATLFERLARMVAHRLRLVDGELRELEER